MALQYLPQEAVAGNPAALHRTASALRKLRSDVAEREDRLYKGIRDSRTFWTGGAGDGYRGRIAADWRPFSVLTIDILPVVSRGCDRLGDALEYAQGRMRLALDAVRAAGMAPWMLVGRVCYEGEPAPGHGQVSQYPGYWVRYGNNLVVNRRDPAQFQPIVDQAALAFKTALEARKAFVREIGGAREELARLLYTAPTAAEQAVDARVGRGELTDLGIGLQRLYGWWTETAPDPQGRILLYRYGNPYRADGVFYHDGSGWAEYLKSNELLKSQVRAMLTDHAKRAVSLGERAFDVRRNLNVEGGHVTGYETLHGTDATVGDFHVKGNSTVVPRTDGGYEVTLRATYTWNDILDPNSSYLKDRLGSTIYRGEPYDVHIEWTGTTTVLLNSRRRVVSVQGYAGNGQ
jgi:hypothetical protein